MHNKARSRSPKPDNFFGLYQWYNLACPMKIHGLHQQSVPQDQKSVTFSHSVISLNQLLQNSKNTAYIFLTFRNHVKIFLSQNILQNILNVVYRTTLSIRTERTDKQWRHWSDCSLRSSLIRVFTVCHLSASFTQWYCKKNPNCSVLGYFQYFFQVFQFLEVFIWKKVCFDSLWVQKMITLGSYS